MIFVFFVCDVFLFRVFVSRVVVLWCCFSSLLLLLFLFLYVFMYVCFVFFFFARVCLFFFLFLCCRIVFYVRCFSLSLSAFALATVVVIAASAVFPLVVPAAVCLARLVLVVAFVFAAFVGSIINI